jgi:MraZ protein
MFQGKFEHAVDEKGRMAIPAPFRKKLQTDPENSEEVSVYVTISDQCLAVYPASEWSMKIAQIAKLNQFDPKVMAFKRIFVGCAQECQVDKAGRILLPPDLRRDLKIDRNCVIVGQIEKFEIWSAERWNDSYNQLSDQVASVYASLAEFGIQI